MTRFGRMVAVVGVALAGLGGAAAFQAEAFPRYSARYEQKCSLCHVNPSGGGMRVAYASQKIIPEEIAWSKAKPEVLAGIEPQIAKNILIGADFRELFLGSDVTGGQRDFFQMQGSLYFNFQLSPKIALHLNQGMSGNYEVYGLGFLTPKLYLKTGRFVPAFGWKFDDHTMYVRNELGFAPPLNADVGVEAGYYPGHAEIQFGVVNGAPGSTLDNDSHLATALNAGFRFHGGPFGAYVGIEGYDNQSVIQRFDAWGGRGYLTWKNLTWVGEADLFRRQPSGGGEVTGFTASNELTWLAHQGLDLKATYDFFDPDRDLASGAKSRWGAGIYVMPVSYLTFEVLERRTVFDNGIAYSGIDNWESVFQLHLLY